MVIFHLVLFAKGGYNMKVEQLENKNQFIILGDNREIEFQSYGRIHTYEQSIELDKKIRDVYNFANATYLEVNSVTAVDEILNHISSLGK